MPLSPSLILRSTRKPSVPAKSILKLEWITGYPYDEIFGDTRLRARSNGIVSLYPSPPTYYPKVINATWFIEETDGLGVGSYGDFSPILDDNTSSLYVGSYGSFLEGDEIEDALSQIKVGTYATIYMGPSGRNWVKWSNIGSLDFTIWKDNVAGERPLDWKGLVYSIRKLGSNVVAYGENGVSFLIPAGNTYGLKTILTLGLKGKQAVSGNDNTHYFIDNLGQLWSLSDSLDLLDYSEYLSSLTNPVLSWDARNELLYICTGTQGYVYCPKTKSLGSGPTNVTGVATQGGVLYTVAPSAITTPAFEVCSDIYDMGTHKYKTIFEIEFGTNITGTLQAAIDYRASFSDDFSQTAWKTVPEKGAVLITALGREFRIRAKVLAWEYLEMDYIIVKGLVHDH